MVICVNELPDGTASSAIGDVSREFQKLRKIAHAIGMPNPDSINWTLIAASTSDSAASQKRFNKLIERKMKLYLGLLLLILLILLRVFVQCISA